MLSLTNSKYEVIRTIHNLFNSNIKSTTISKETGISYTSISELRNRKRTIENTSFEKIIELYDYSVMKNFSEYKASVHKVNVEGIINMEMKIDGLVVAFNDIDIFAMGKLQLDKGIATTFGEGEVKNIYINNSVFKLKDKVLPTNLFGFGFNCRYGGSGPCNLIRFLKDNTDLEEAFIENIVKKKAIVEYDFKKRELKGYDSILGGYGIGLYYYKNKLIIGLDDFSNRHIPGKSQFNLKSSIKLIDKLKNILNQLYNKNTNLNCIRYIDHERAHRNSDGAIKMSARDYIEYHIKLEYDEFEIWIPYYFGEIKEKRLFRKDRGIFDSEEFMGFINMLGIEEEDIKNKVVVK